MSRDSVIRLRTLDVLLDPISVAVSRHDKGMELLVDEKHGSAFHGRTAVHGSSDTVELYTEALRQVLDLVNIRSSSRRTLSFTWSSCRPRISMEPSAVQRPISPVLYIMDLYCW